MPWTLGHLDSTGARMIQPIDGRALREVERRAQSAVAGRRPRKGSSRDPRDPLSAGTSHLERFAGTLTEKAREIDRFARVQDDQRAWAALANGYRVVELRAVLEKAMIHVGIERIDSLVTLHPGDDVAQWDPMLIEWIERTMANEDARRNEPWTPKAHWSDNDYGMVDW